MYHYLVSLCTFYAQPPPFLVLPHSPFVLAPLYCKLRQSSGRAGPGGLLGAGARGHWLVTSFARALSELPAEKVRTCWAALAKAFPSDNTDHATLLLEAKANRDRLFPGGAMPEPTETEEDGGGGAGRRRGRG